MFKVLIAGMIGNALEWYSYSLYAQFAKIIGQSFFPVSYDPYTAMISAFSVFAAGFLTRPLGAMFFGVIGDKYGRKTALSIAIMMMSIPTACIGLLPSYATIGLWAPILLTIIRLLQGLSMGGEFSGAMAYMIEHAHPEHRALVASTTYVSMCMGILLGLITELGLRFMLPENEVEEWAWRIPFVCVSLMGVIGLYIRLFLSESPAYKYAKLHSNLSATPIRDVFVKNYHIVLQSIALYSTVATAFYTIVIYVKNFMQTILFYPAYEAIIINSITLIIIMLVTPMAAAISDKIGRIPILVLGLLLIVVTLYPALWLLLRGGFILPLLSQMIMAVALSFYLGPMPAALAELFPTRIRFTGVAVSYNFTAGLGGLLPLFGFYVMKLTGDYYFIAYFISITNVLSMSAIFFFKESYRKEILYN